MKRFLCAGQLRQENRRFHGSGGRSQETRACGFRPAFCDRDTASVYLSRFSDGEPAPVHVLDGLPEEVVTCRSPSGRVLQVKQSVVSGFVLGDRFFTREEAANHVALHK